MGSGEKIMKKQAVFVRIPGIQAYSDEFKRHLAKVIQDALQSQFEREITVLVFNEDIHFMNSGDIRDLIDTMENLIK